MATTKPDPAAFLNADIPITEDSAEKLGRMHFVRLLSRRALTYTGERALVIGVCGPWGSGKTSIVNLLMNEIRNAASTAGRPVLAPVKFTPWALGARDDLARDLLGEIGRMVKDRAGAKAVAVEIGTQIVDVGTALAVAGGSYKAGAPEWFASALATLGIGGRVKAALDKALSNQAAPSLQEATDRVSRKLRDSNALLVVALDDLERLPVDQILAVFRVVSAIADFPNTIYFLCMDRHRVAEALNSEYGDGHAYLEKFLNLTFDVPAPDPERLSSLLIDQLNPILSARGVEADAKRFDAVWHGGLKGLIQTPRDVVRVLNSFDMALDAISYETEPIDLLVLETLRVLEPGVHRGLGRHPFAVLRNKNDFNSILGIHTDEERKRKADTEFETILSAASEERRESTRDVIRMVFPMEPWGGRDDTAALHRAKRAASIEHFDNYFRWNISNGSLSEVEFLREVDGLIQARTDPALRLWWEGNSHRIRRLIEKLRNFTDTYTNPVQALDLAAGLLRACDRFDDNSVFQSNHMAAIHLAHQLVKRAPKAWDVELWIRFQGTSWLYGLTHLFAIQCNEQSQDRLPGLAAPSDETRIALSTLISANLENGVYDDHHALAHFLLRWGKVAGDNIGPRDWLRKKVALRSPLVWLIVDPLINVVGVMEHFNGIYTAQNRENLAILFDLAALSEYVANVPHPRDAVSKVAATRMALEEQGENQTVNDR